MDNTRFENQFDDMGRMRILDGMRYYKKTADQNNMACIRIILNDPVDRACLEYAAEIAMRRLRVFSMVVEKDETRFYLKQNTRKPVVHLENGQRHTVCTYENNGHMTRIGYHDNMIEIDFFHGITDGMGVIAFQKTLLYYYVSKKYGKPEDIVADTLREETPEDPREYADSLLFIEGEAAEVEPAYRYERAFQLPDMQIESEYECRLFEFKIDAKEFESYMRKNGSSRSAVFTLFMNRVIEECNDTQGEPIVAALAANARKHYGAEKTLQCCVSTVPIWYDNEIKALSLPQQLKKTREMIVEGVRTERVRAAAQNLKKFNQTLEERFRTLEEKQAFAKTVNKQGGIKYTYGLSYLGELSYGKGIDQYVQDNYVILSANTIPVIMEIAKWGEQYHVSYATHLQEDPYVYKLRDMFVNEGISCICTEKENFVEAYAAF